MLSKQTIKPIVESWEKQTEFVQNASHELRTPLTIIQAKQELLLQNPNAKIIDKSEDINIILKETKRLTKLIKELMALAMADSNELINIWENALQSDDNNEDYILPGSDTRYISESELSGLTREEVCTAINELYARHGRRFNGTSWQAYFDSKSWYVPMVDPDDFSESVFNNYELENKKTLVKWEEDHGWR